MLVWVPSTRISHLIVPASFFSRLQYPDWPGMYGNRYRRFLPAYRAHRASSSWPGRACITARVSSSASVISAAIPVPGRHGARYGSDFSRSSISAYSAVARVSRSASTAGLHGSAFGLATPILDTLRHKPGATRRTAPLGLNHLAAETAPRSTITQIYEGTNQIQRMVMARQLLK
jgi:hypothetical protein